MDKIYKWINDIFLDKRSKPRLIPLIILILVVFMFIGGFLFISNSSSSGNEGENMNITQDIPAKNENLELQNNKEVEYLTRKELNAILDKNFNSAQQNIKNNLKGYIDIELEDQKDNIALEREDEILKLKEKLEDRNKTIEDLNLRIESVERVNKIIRKDKNSLEDKYKHLENEIAVLKDEIRDIDLDEILRAIENNKPETVEKLVTRQQPEVREPKPEPEPENNIKFNGLISSGNNNIAIINVNGSEYLVGEGESFNGFKLLKASKSEITVNINGSKKTYYKGD